LCDRGLMDKKVVTGARTRYWGPHAWTIIHSMAAAGDIVIDNTGKKTSPKWQNKFWLILQRALPCKVCRDSCATFINELEKTMSLSEQAFSLHESVNCKLFEQDIAKVRDHKLTARECVDKWGGYQYRIGSKTKSIESIEFLSSTCFFCVFMSTDFNMERGSIVIDVLHLIGKIIPQKSVKLRKAWQNAIKTLPLEVCKWESLEQRLKIVHNFFLLIRNEIIMDNLSFPTLEVMRILSTRSAITKHV
jgi:hypothetical protein